MAIVQWGPNRAPNAGGMKKIVLFDQYLALSRKRYKIEPKSLWNENRKLSNVTVSDYGSILYHFRDKARY